MVGIYRITSPSGKVYIGQSWDIHARKGSYRRLECKSQRKLFASLEKYKWDNHEFEVLQELPKDITQEVLDQLEIFFIQQYANGGYNLLNLRTGGNGGGKHTEESKQKMSDSRKGTRMGADNHMYGKPCMWAGKKRSPETIEKVRKSLLGRKQSEEAKKKIGDIHRGLNHREESKKKISEAMKRIRAEEKEKGIIRRWKK